MKEKTSIRSMNTADLGCVSKIHELAFPNFFLTRMGDRFIRNYYQTVLDFEGSIALVAINCDDGEVIGFATGFQNPARFYDFFKTQRKRLAPMIFLSALRDPSLIFQILRNSRRISNSDHGDEYDTELSSIAVSDRQLGVGTKLIDAFTKEALKSTTKNIVLTTDLENNEQTRRFYENKGFNMTHVEQRGNRRVCHYSKPL